MSLELGPTVLCVWIPLLRHAMWNEDEYVVYDYVL